MNVCSWFLKSTILIKVSSRHFAKYFSISFFSQHDSGSICAPGGDAGNYIMYPSATKGNLRNNELFSECSRDNITRVLNAVVNQINGKVNCFTGTCWNSFDKCEQTCIFCRKNLNRKIYDVLYLNIKTKDIYLFWRWTQHSLIMES